MASAIIKRRRAIKRTDVDGDPEFQVAPMVDVLLVLLLFFMSITSTELLKKERNLHLAEADRAKKDENKKTHEVVINVTWDGINSVAGFIMDGATYPDAASFTGVLAQRVRQDPLLYVLIRADKDVQYSNISDLMTACAGAGIGTVTFAVIQGAPPVPPAGAGATSASN